MPTDLLTTIDVAELAKCSPDTVRRWVDEGLLTPVLRLPGGAYRFERADVLALLTPTTEPTEATA